MNASYFYLFLILVRLTCYSTAALTNSKVSIQKTKSQIEFLMKYMKKINENNFETADDKLKTKLKYDIVKALLMEKVDMTTNLNRIINDAFYVPATTSTVTPAASTASMKQQIQKSTKSALGCHSNGARERERGEGYILDFNLND